MTNVVCHEKVTANETKFLPRAKDGEAEKGDRTKRKEMQKYRAVGGERENTRAGTNANYIANEHLQGLRNVTVAIQSRLACFKSRAERYEA